MPCIHPSIHLLHYITYNILPHLFSLSLAGLAFRFSTPTSRRSSPDFFQVLDSDAGSLLVGGKDAVFNLSLDDLSEFTDEVRICARIEQRTVSCLQSIPLIPSSARAPLISVLLTAPRMSG